MTSRMKAAARSFATPRDGDLRLRRIANATGLSVSILPNGTIFAIEHERGTSRVMINQVLGSPVHGGIGRLVLRLGGQEPRNVDITGPAANVQIGVGADRIVWAGETAGVRHHTSLWLHPDSNVWLWQVEARHVEATSTFELPCDVVLVQDIGLGERNFLMGNEAYASQYTDHHIARHSRMGPVVMSRQNLAQGGGHPWIAHGCLDGAASFATDAMQFFGPAFRDAAGTTLAFGTNLPGERLQHEAACPMIQSRPAMLAAGRAASWTFFGIYDPDHREASSDADLASLDLVQRAREQFRRAKTKMEVPARGIIQDAAPIIARSLSAEDLAAAFPDRRHEEWREGRLLSFFAPDGPHNRHVVLRDKERLVPRRHGAMLRSGKAVLPDAATLCATGWMHGVFAAQLTIGNTSFHKLFSVSRDPYNITRASGLRILVELDGRWRLLATPSAFDIGLNDCRWLYHLDDRRITVHAIASGEHAAMQWQVDVTGAPCRFLVLGHLVLGERELDHASPVMIDPARKRCSFRPDPTWLWAQHYPNAVYHLVTGTPRSVAAIGGDELLYADGKPRDGAYVALRTHATRAFGFAVVGSLTDAVEAERLAQNYETGVATAAMLAPATQYWAHLSRELRLRGRTDGSQEHLAAIETVFPWFAHDAMMHVTVPHGLEQYTGAAWGTRDVCQGPVEFFLSLEHDAPAREILRILFAQQYEQRGDWPQWFMLEPYSIIQDAHALGDVIVWPLKALCDYVEATNDFAFLDEMIAWRREDNFENTERRDSIAAHIDKLIATVKARFVSGTHLISYGEGDWNDSLQPVDPAMRDRMVSSWTVALLFEQIGRYAEVQRRVGRGVAAAELEGLAAAMAADFNHHLVRDGIVAGYGVFEPGTDRPELLLHPSDQRTGLSYSLLPMTQCIIGSLFTRDQAQAHLALIREHLLFPDGARLMDRPVAYRGGPETTFRRAESSSFFGREIGLMYVHAHLRYGEAMAALGEAESLWDALAVANPIAVTDRLAHASPRQRNCYFSSSDASFRDRYEASATWQRVRTGRVPVDGGWRVYSSGPGLYANLLIRHALGLRRRFGERVVAPVIPASLGELRLELTIDGRLQAWDLSDAGN
ncbi:Cellobiose phosphorylase [Rhizobiales bacterium GAS188]|nr:Cellobiose phosphorylase [Rhizobiales bacterium GAS188]